METISIVNKRNKIHPHKFALWAAMASIMMMFGAFTSAYIVKQAGGNWLDFSLPSVFYLSTAVIILSGASVHLSFNAYKAAKFAKYKYLLVAGFVLGIAFLVCQYYGWSTLFERGVDLKGNVSGSFLYLITGVHALHVLGGLAAIAVAILHAYTLKPVVTQKRMDRFELVVHYWHFVDILWIYLLIFLMFKK